MIKGNDSTKVASKPVGTLTRRNEPNVTLIAKSVLITFKNGATTK